MIFIDTLPLKSLYYPLSLVSVYVHEYTVKGDPLATLVVPPEERVVPTLRRPDPEVI